MNETNETVTKLSHKIENNSNLSKLDDESIERRKQEETEFHTVESAGWGKKGKGEKKLLFSGD